MIAVVMLLGGQGTSSGDNLDAPWIDGIDDDAEGDMRLVEVIAHRHVSGSAAAPEPPGLVVCLAAIGSAITARVGIARPRRVARPEVSGARPLLESTLARSVHSRPPATRFYTAHPAGEFILPMVPVTWVHGKGFRSDRLRPANLAGHPQAERHRRRSARSRSELCWPPVSGRQPARCPPSGQPRQETTCRDT